MSIPTNLNRRMDLRDPRPEKVQFARENLAIIEGRHLSTFAGKPAAALASDIAASPERTPRTHWLAWCVAVACDCLWAVLGVAGGALVALGCIIMAFVLWMREPKARVGISGEAYAAGHEEMDGGGE